MPCLYGKIFMFAFYRQLMIAFVFYAKTAPAQSEIAAEDQTFSTRSSAKSASKWMIGMKNSEKKKSRKSWIIIVATVVVFLATAVVLLVGTSGGRRLTTKAAAGYIHNNIQYVPAGQDTSYSSNYNTETQPSKEQNKTADEDYDQREYFHFLLLGEEAIASTAGKGRTDLMMLATINVPEKSIKLVSLLRDTLVQIPGYADGKLNSVYAKGGVSLLYETIEQNYGILPDAYALVGFQNFEKLIDRLGGVEITLGNEEAEYLNTTKYISNPEDRNVVAGKQTLNGAQTLGYCRIRKVPNVNGTKFDYGRTERQRMVLESLFHQYISAGIYEWVPLIRETIGMVQTDISLELLESVLFAVYDNKITKLDTLQLPKEGMFQEKEQVGGITAVLVPDWEKTRECLQEFLFEDK